MKAPKAHPLYPFISSAYCEMQKCLDKKTLKAYRTDLNQFVSFFHNTSINAVSIPDIEKYIGHLRQNFKPKTAKRRPASIQSFYHYLEYKDFTGQSPFHQIKTKLLKSIMLPKTIPLYIVGRLLIAIYKEFPLAYPASDRLLPSFLSRSAIFSPIIRC